MKLIPMLVLSVILAYVSEKQSVIAVDESNRVHFMRRDKTWWIILAVCLAVLCGLRLKGNDTGLYRGMYQEYIPGLFNIDWLQIASAPGFTFVGIGIKTIGASVQDYLMILSLFTIGTYIWFIHKYSTSFAVSVYYFVTMGVYIFTFAAIKQTLAVAILLIATDRLIHKKYVWFAVLVLLAELFHPFSLAYLIMPFLFFDPWKKNTYFILLGAIVIVFSLSGILTRLIELTDSIGYQYSEEGFSQEGVNVFRVLVVWVPTVLSFVVNRKSRGNLSRGEQLIVNASMINSVIMFIGLFGTANYFARLANYFLIFQTLSLPILLRFLDERSRRLTVFFSFVGYFMFFYYESYMVYGSFESRYSFMKLTDYVMQLIRR